MGNIVNKFTFQLTHTKENYYAVMHKIGAHAGEFACIGGDFFLLVLLL